MKIEKVKRLFTILILVTGLLYGSGVSAQQGYYFDGTVGPFETSLVGRGFGSENDVTSVLQELIDSASVQPQGGTILLSGEVQLSQVYLRSNVHINIRKGTVIMGTPGVGPAMFNMAVESEEHIENVKIFCDDCDREAPNDDSTEKYVFDLSNFGIHEKFRAFMLGNITNFWISDYFISDNQTKFSSLTLNPVLKDLTNNKEIPMPLRDWKVVSSPLKGDIINAHIKNSHDGYGLIQVQCARDVNFEKISGIGGVTLRMESGSGVQFVGTFNEREMGIIRGIRARDVSLINGGSAVTLNPHGRINGDVYLDDIKADSCAFAVKAVTGFFDRELMVEEGGDRVLIDAVKFRKGRFEGPVVIRKAHAVFGLNGSGRYGLEYLYVEKSLREANPWDGLPEVSPGSKARRIPSIATIGYKSIPHADAVPDTVEGEFTITVEGPVSSEGFPHCLDSIYGNVIYDGDKEKVDCSQFPVDTTSTYISQEDIKELVYPNPARDFIHIHHPAGSEIVIFNSLGAQVCRLESGSENISTLNVSGFPGGLYFVQNAERTYCEKVIIE